MGAPRPPTWSAGAEMPHTLPHAEVASWAESEQVIYFFLFLFLLFHISIFGIFIFTELFS
jgi:hypothetical protein